MDEKSIVVQAENVTSGYAKGINATDATTLEKGDYTTTATTNDDGSKTFEVKINDLKNLVDRLIKSVKTSDTIVVTYDAKLNGNAVIGGAGNVNKVQLHYSNNPTGKGIGKTNEKNAKVYTYELDVNKVTGEKALAGAGFTLQKKDGNTYKTVATIDPDHPTYDSSIVAKIVNGSKFEFSGLDQGEYKIVESTVPKGYHKADDVYFTITATFEGQNSADAHLETLSVGKGFTANKDSGIVSTYVNNVSDKGFVLPSTGGMGRYIFLAVGALVVVAAVLPKPSLKKTAKVNGTAYSGYLSFPSLGLSLPVASKWRFSQLEVSPATYTGTAKGRNWIVAGHNFVNHFGRLNQLKVGDKIYFESATGQRYVYQVQKMEVLQPTAISKMVRSKYDLSLFTCTYDGTTRFTVRCHLLQIK